MAAGLGFKTFATGDVLSAADTNGYLMQGVLVFASAAARDSAITSPQEGQFAYLKDTNVTTYYTGSAWANLDTTGMTNPMTTTGDMVYSSSGSTPARLGIGTTGQVLSVAGGIPSWAAASSGALTLISSTTLVSSTTSVTFSSISSSYTHLQVIYNVIGADDFMKMSFNNVTTNTYYSQQMNARGTTVGADESLNVANMRCGVNQSNGGGWGTITIPNYKNTTIKKGITAVTGDRQNTSGNGTRVQMFSGGNDSTDAISRIDITCASNFTAGSIFSLYGVS